MQITSTSVEMCSIYSRIEISNGRKLSLPESNIPFKYRAVLKTFQNTEVLEVLITKSINMT